MPSRKEMLNKLIDYSNNIKDLITRSDVPDKEVFNAMCRSPYSEDDWADFKVTSRCGAYGIQEFSYRGFVFNITAVMNEERFVCWLEQDASKGCLENTYLVPEAWIWGTTVDEQDVRTIFLPAIDKYLQEIGVDNIK